MKAALALMLVALAPAAAYAAPEDVANAVAHEVMSPYCPGVTLHDCPSSEAQEMRETIVAWAEEGMTKDAIIDRLEDEFGPSVRAVPRAEGAGLLAWLLPGLAVAGGAVAAALLARRWARRGPPPAAAAPAADPGATARLKAELDRVRSES
jgi:cytochrome c-type biogenesis protein CcmH/NrfF